MNHKKELLRSLSVSKGLGMFGLDRQEDSGKHCSEGAAGVFWFDGYGVLGHGQSCGFLPVCWALLCFICVMLRHGAQHMDFELRLSLASSPASVETERGRTIKAAARYQRVQNLAIGGLES